MSDNENWRDKLGTVSWKRLCTVLFVVLLTIQVVVLVFYHDAMYSPLNKNAHPKRAFHNEMLENAVQYVDNLPSGAISDVLLNATTSVQMAIIIPTTQRKQRYLDVCLWSLFEYNSLASFDSTTLTLINTARNGEVSNADLDRWRHKLAAKKEWPLPIQILNATSMDSTTTGASWYRRGVMDYVQSLKECVRQEASWCLILEEDVVLRRNFLSTFRKVVAKRMSLKRTRRKKIGMVKLFVSDYWDGFSNSWVHVRDVVLVGIFALVFLMVLFRCSLMPARAPVVRQRNNRGGARCKCFSSYVVSVLGFYLIWRSMGRQALLNVVELPRAIHLDPIRGTAGTVGIAFPATALTALCDYLDKQLLLTSSKGISPIDVTLNEWLGASSFKALRTRPSLVQHMGLYSSAGRKNQGNMNFMKQDSAFTF